MRIRLASALLILAGLSGCGNQSPLPAAPAAVTHAYNGTASVGDFLTITINSTALTITYDDLTNGLTGTVPYTVNANGSYTLNDPKGHLISAYEVPGYALVIQANNVGPNSDTAALITAVESGPITLSTFANNSYNYMSFRTNFGGVEIGSISIGPTSGTNTNYWPYGNVNPGSGGAFGGGSMDFSGLAESASGTYISGVIPNAGGGTETIFGTASGFFIVDTPNGSIIGLPKAATSAFDPTVAGTYSGIFYEKADVTMAEGTNTETGAPSTGQAKIVVTAAVGTTLPNITVTDSNGNTFINAALTPVANSPNLYGSAGKLTDPCNGLFTFRAVTGTYEHDVFVTFVGNSVVFSKFSANLPWTQSSGYSYWYGVGLK
jgi:predicted small lipoprotein YifL